MSLTADIKTYAHELGFDMVGVTRVGPPAHAAAFADWLAAGRHGEMRYLPARAAVRADPGLLAPGAHSLIALGVNYNPGSPPAAWDDPTHGRIARYAWAPDYHDAIKPRLYQLDAFIRERKGRAALGKACVDSAPLLERDFAMSAAVGFMGRNTCLITPGLGSWTLLAALLVPETLDYDELRTLDPPADVTEPVQPIPLGATWALQTGAGTCGHCFRCLAACPTHAFAGPHILDARRCISYLTIELRGPIPRDLRPLMGNWIFGCDVCQEVCPYNRAAPAATSPLIVADTSQAAPALLDLLALDEAGFRSLFRGSPILRVKRRGLVRNACIAAGNCPAWQTDAGGDPMVAVSTLAALLDDAEPLVRGHAAWALGRLGGEAARAALARAAATEADAWVREEMADALANQIG
jgi:epoxyqueuosine reductase